MDMRKTLTDTAYVTIGLGVLGVQQAQVRRRELQQRLAGSGGCLNDRARDGRARIESLQQTVDGLAQTVRDRIEPVVDQVVEQALRVQTVIGRAA
jgi:hypothetical protein